jgi:hypothetical protein
VVYIGLKPQKEKAEVKSVNVHERAMKSLVELNSNGIQIPKNRDGQKDYEKGRADRIAAYNKEAARLKMVEEMKKECIGSLV